MEWFKEWFNSPYYHILYDSRNELEAKYFINNLTEYLGDIKNKKLLDVACGKGRHAVYFNSLGLNVTGIDLSINSINIAQKQSSNTLCFCVHDMREIYQKEEFDIVTNLFTSLGYFKNDKEEQQAINAMANNLKKGGTLIIDFMNSKKIRKHLIVEEQKQINGIDFNIKRIPLEKYIVKEINIIHTKTYLFQEKVRTFTLEELSNLILNAGLKIIDIFGDYNMQKFNKEESNRLILICTK